MFGKLIDYGSCGAKGDYESQQRPSVGRDRDDMFDVGPGHHMPQLCPRCHSMNTLILIEYDTEQMSEGQLADYLAGVSGTALCDACEFEFDFGM